MGYSYRIILNTCCHSQLFYCLLKIQPLKVVINALWNQVKHLECIHIVRILVMSHAPFDWSTCNIKHLFTVTSSRYFIVGEISIMFICCNSLACTYTLKKSYKRPPHIFFSSSESKIRSIKIHDHMNKPMSNSGSVGFCIPKCMILLTQTKHV